MQGRRSASFHDFGDPFAGFGSFGGFEGHRNLVSSFFGGRDPFDDPFFAQPFGGMFQPSLFGPRGGPFMDNLGTGFLEQQALQTNTRGPIIEELNSDDEKEEEEKKNNPRKHRRSTKEHYVDDADEAAGRKSKQMLYRNEYNRMTNTNPQPQGRSFSFTSSSVTYGGVNGAYYTSSTTRRAGSDGVTFEESKEADTTTGQATHRVSRGIHNKGHSLTRKLNSDGRVNTMQTLHNLNENELSGFEEAWQGNASKYLPGWDERFNGQDMNGQSSRRQANRGGWALPSTERVAPAAGSHSQHPRTEAGVGDRASLSRGRAKPPTTTTRINID